MPFTLTLSGQRLNMPTYAAGDRPVIILYDAVIRGWAIEGLLYCAAEE
jgi:hypothetical protein